MWGSPCLEDSVEKEIYTVLQDTDLEPHKEEILNLNGSQRVHYVYNVLRNSDVFKNLAMKQENKKSNGMSEELRSKGNNLYIRERKMLEAIELYNQSISYAEIGSSFLGISYANRSAILLQRNYYKECLEDIDRALQNNYPEHLKDKLVQRRNQAERLIANQKNVHYYSPAPTIQNRNPRIDAASDSVEIRRNSKFGRLIVATKDIKVGDVIVSENSFAHIIHPESRYLHCHECLDICFNLIPCERCNALYCSESCLERAFNDCHKYECGMAFLFHKYPQLFIRLAIKGLREHQNHGDATLDETYRSDRYKEISELATNENKRDFLNTCVHITIVCLCYHNLIENPHFRRDFDLDAVDDLLKKLLYHSYMIHAFNPFNIKKLKYTALQTRSRRVGTAIYAFTSLLNHSCVPNCEFFHHGTVLVTRAIANIRKGEQCTICYGTSYSSTDIRIRQMSLKRYYLFKCDCKACAKKWPQFEGLPEGRPIPQRFQEKVAQNTFEDTEENRHRLEDILKDALRLYSTYERFEPCKNLLRIQNTITEIYSTFGCKFMDF